ncbi:FMN-binding protein [Ruminococcus sp. AF37-6AT]|jgi:major membrane immunogen (membrane-anchored lipoprotein)|uniref:FMN-binding protein n=1 Tax=Blautia sp. HCN-1074 TaxID=3134667 RepID=UPI000E4BF8C9|nr:FMN-binding protein [Ruminococcus sp. AF13-37]RGW22034.1 FMN-binding protein [Ruminococcus sp. AF13-28]RHD94201.1 FMN-binding protein [Ruminococcus sp. AM30-15AC]RHG56910.1 FMN-binding protein [Ruminococcus sp. AM22-13]RHJ99038.1 FMN-binding protein [Ruminococcus sp. AM07-21]RHL50788.1 FMN-binding protein [Ruminococcus sp. AF37-6AT]RHP58033.1 FMN-binding protein [Ruminococcus sp. AF31-16BH]RHQ65909.1 FMN-binding protein [Ruminococcus sp. AF24-32LB]RHT52999.1 FMN-binding protein [Ruminoco
MKKRIIAVLLSAVMMVPSVSVGATDFAEGNGEQIFSEGEETRELIFTEGEDTVDFSSEENTQEVFSAESSADGIILNEKTFIKGKTYLIPVSLKNAANHEKDSAAVSCPGKFATLYIGEDGIPKLTVNLRSVTVGTMTDYAYDFKIYQSAGTDGEKQGAFVENTQIVPAIDGSGTRNVPETISFAIPEAAFGQDGVYLNMYVDVMGRDSDAYLQMNYAEAKESGDTSLNYTTEVASAVVEQFGNYSVTAQVTVKDGQISDVVLEGTDFKGSYINENQAYLNRAVNGMGSIKGMKEKLTGLYINDTDKLNNLDTVSGATYSSNAVKQAVMKALGMEIYQEVLPDVPEKKPEAGTYRITVRGRTDMSDHKLLGSSDKADAVLRVDTKGKMWLTYKMVSGDPGEPLWVLGYNGYYPGNNTSGKLSMDGVTFSTEKMTIPTIGSSSVVTEVTVPLDEMRQTYLNNLYLYVDVMKKLDGEVSGIIFDKGKFNINSTLTLYWDTLKKISNDTGDTEKPAVKQKNPTIRTKVSSKTFTVSLLKKKSQSFTLGASVNSKGKLSYKKTSGSSGISVNSKTGKITVKKGMKKGNYKIKVQIKAAAKGNYKAGTKTVTIIVKVK